MNRMEKDEILRRAQAQTGEGELEERTFQKGYQFSTFVGFILLLVLVTLKRQFGQNTKDLFAMYFLVTSVPYFYRWYKLRRGSDLLWGLLFMGVGILELLWYVLSLLS